MLASGFPSLGLQLLNWEVGELGQMISTIVSSSNMLQYLVWVGSAGQGSALADAWKGYGVGGEGLRKLPHPQLWFLVGPPWQQVEGSVCQPSNKALKQRPPRALWEQAAKAHKTPKIKHTFPLIDTGNCRGAWPGGGEEKAQISCPRVRPRPVSHTDTHHTGSTHIHIYKLYTLVYTASITARDPCGPAELALRRAHA